MRLQKKLWLLGAATLVFGKVTAQEELPTIDYTQLGTAMPPLSYMEWIDTSSQAMLQGKKKRKASIPTSIVPTGYYKLSTATDLKPQGNTAVMIFSPECTHCNKIVSLLEERLNEISDTHIILLTTAKMQELLPYFADSHRMARPPKVHIGYDSAQFVPKTFHYQPLPQVNVYDRNGILIKSFVSNVVADSLSAWIK